MMYRAIFLLCVWCVYTTSGGILDSAKNLIHGGSDFVKESVHNVFNFDSPPKRTPIPEFIKEAGYESESHYVTTPDGYILNIHRIPRGKTNKPKKDIPVYLQHGLLCSSADWVILGPNKSLSFLLADEGYDVWLGNVRGNTYSRNHTTLSPDKDADAFWDFSWNEIGIYDIPTMIDYILKATGKSQVFHVGHSQGTTSFYVMTSERPQYNRKVKAHISLAPVAFMKHLISPLVRVLAYGNLPFGNQQTFIGKNEFFPSTAFLVLLNDAICGVGVGAVYCKISIFALAGFSPNEMDAKDTSVIYAHYPAGAATRQILHYTQEVVSGHFRKYDFGKTKNKQLYNGSEVPPNYDLFKITAPIHLIYSSNDWLSHETDVENLYQHLKSVREKFWVPIPTWNHMDYLFGKDAPKLIYEKIMNILNKYED
ncbi:lipase 3-like [Diabrotica undecimpunctata]|uniref:lipase 3-like n=1 Tax=Diabrotica undecimpunctata TaxID=50387 RepID=UPI003B63FE14